MVKFVAILPLRCGSKGIPNKNFKKFNNQPLFYWTLEALNKCSHISKVIISCDEPTKVGDAQKISKKAILYKRKPETATDTASTEQAIDDVIESVPEAQSAENLILVQATSPLLTSDDLQKGISKFLNSKADSLLSVVQQERFIWKEDESQATPLNYDPRHRPRRQDFSGHLVENGAFYIFNKSGYLKKRSRLFGKIVTSKMPDYTYFEIDNQHDWIVLENIHKQIVPNKTSNLNSKNIKLVISDMDGVFTDGGMIYNHQGDYLRKFNTKDGMGIARLLENNILFILISGEKSFAVQKRFEKLKATEIHLGIQDKVSLLEDLCVKYSLKPSEIAFIGDDLNDLQILKAVGLSACPSDAVDEVKDAALVILNKKGGQGVFREFADMIIKSL